MGDDCLNKGLIQEHQDPHGHLTEAVEAGLHLSTIFVHPAYKRHLPCSEVRGPKIAAQHIPLLFYEDDVVLLSRTPTGIKQAMKILAWYYQANHMEINYQKSKVLT